MATLIEGINGPVKGKLGTVVGSSWKGEHYVKHKGKSNSKPPTAAQLANQAKFALAMKFAHGLKELLNISLGEVGKKTGLNFALAAIKTQAITGSYPNYGIDFSNVFISRGYLHNVYAPTVKDMGEGRLLFRWTDNGGGPFANPGDEGILVVHCPETNAFLVETRGIQRSDGSALLSLPAFTSRAIHAWISFRDPRTGDYATSSYCGELIIS